MSIQMAAVAARVIPGQTPEGPAAPAAPTATSTPPAITPPANPELPPATASAPDTAKPAALPPKPAATPEPAPESAPEKTEKAVAPEAAPAASAKPAAPAVSNEEVLNEGLALKEILIGIKNGFPAQTPDGRQVFIKPRLPMAAMSHVNGGFNALDRANSESDNNVAIAVLDKALQSILDNRVIMNACGGQVNSILQRHGLGGGEAADTSKVNRGF